MQHADRTRDKGRNIIKRAIEFFAGVGGFAVAAKRRWGSELNITAIDIDLDAQRVIQLNHRHATMASEITSLGHHTLSSINAELWWMSPPCQPYSRRGHQHDIEDRRAASLLHLIEQIELVRPRTIALENVDGFASSQAFALLRDCLRRCNYSVMHRHICPTELGWPNRRPRFYLLASLDAVSDWRPLPRYDCSVAQLIDGIEFDQTQCQVSPDIIERYGAGMDRVDPAQPGCVTACFGSSYGKSILHAGSYCRQGDTYRRFAPAEVASLLGFPRHYQLPPSISYRRAWKLFGNSLSIPVVEYVLSHLTED